MLPDRKRTLKQLKALGDDVRRVLLAEWDPIGVGSECPDEYDSYIPQICRMLIEQASAEELAAHLGGLAEKEMGLASRRASDLHAAECLLRLDTSA